MIRQREILQGLEAWVTILDQLSRVRETTEAAGKTRSM